MRTAIESAGLTDVGRVRPTNEDHFLIADLVKQLRPVQTSLPPSHAGAWGAGTAGHLFVVADGMGGGAVASGLAVETISWYVARTMPWFHRYQDGREKELEEELERAFAVVQDAVTGAAAGSRFGRMGTTLTLACVLWPRVYVVHAGDSRCYLRRGGTLTRCTTDHTVAQRAVDEGVLTAKQAEAAGLGNTLWNCIGGGTKGVTPELHHATLRAGDELLLCTDGLSRRLDDAAILAVLEKSRTAAGAARALVDAANRAGGEDTDTVVGARTRPAGDPGATPPDGTRVLPPA